MLTEKKGDRKTPVHVAPFNIIEQFIPISDIKIFNILETNEEKKRVCVIFSLSNSLRKVIYKKQ